MNAIFTKSGLTQEKEDELLRDLPLPGQSKKAAEPVAVSHEIASPAETDVLVDGQGGPIGPAGPSKDGMAKPSGEPDLPTIKPSKSAESPSAQKAQPDPASTAAISSMPVGFALFEDGIYVMPDKVTAEPRYVCSPLCVDAMFEDRHGHGCGRLVSVKSAKGHWHDIPVSNADLYRRSTDIVERLINHGLQLALDKNAKEHLLNLLHQWKPANQLQSVDRMGWVDDRFNAFVMGPNQVGRADILSLTASTGIAVGLSSRGDLAGWKEHVGQKCRGNPLMVLATSLAFSGPLLAPLGLAGGGLHFRGASSSGKTTLLKLAASVWGDHQLITQWRATSNGLEAIAATVNDMLLPLDEIAEIQACDLNNAIYMLANGTGKARMTKDATLSPQSRWKLALISSGEISVEEKLKEAGLNAKAGHEVRLIDIEADSRSYGVFDNLHGATDAAVFAGAMQKAVRSHHGAVGIKFVERLITHNLMNDADRLLNVIQEQAEQFAAKLPSARDGQISRVAQRFAVIGLAGALATKFGLTGWNKDEAMQAANQAFLDWYDRRYGARRDAVEAFVKVLQDFVAAKLNSLAKVDALQVVGHTPVGWRDTTRVYLPVETWTAIFPASQAADAAKAFLGMEMLLPGDDGRHTRKAPRAIPGRPRLYTVMTDRLMAYKAG